METLLDKLLGLEKYQPRRSCLKQLVEEGTKLVQSQTHPQELCFFTSVPESIACV